VPPPDPWFAAIALAVTVLGGPDDQTVTENGAMVVLPGKLLNVLVPVGITAVKELTQGAKKLEYAG
jgi:hypothetical protein